jgi:AraC-like DNA-binding protein
MATLGTSREGGFRQSVWRASPVQQMGPSTLASWASLIARTLRRYGLDVDAVFRAARVGPGPLPEPTSRYPVAAVRRLWAVASQASQDSCFGLEVGRSWHVTSFHALGYAALASATLREALARVARYCRVVTTGVRVRLIDAGRETTLQLSSTLDAEGGPASLEPAAQAGLAALTTLCREARGAPIHPTRVLLTQDDNGCAPRLAAFFHCPIRFGAPSNALVFAASDLNAPLETSNPGLVRINEQAVTRYLAQIQSAGVGERVRAKLLATLPGCTVSQATVARELHMSQRTMQRRLKGEGLTFRDVLDSARRQLVGQYAEDRSITRTEMAYLLGFSEPRSLTRAMARWKARPDPLS